MSESFFALISRMRHIHRWGLMRSSIPENVQEHSHAVAVIAHALAVIRRDVFGVPCEPNEYASLGLFHDATEIFTGDLPTPIKYYNAQMVTSYKEVEHQAARKLVSLLPEAMRSAYAPLLLEEDADKHALVKAADKLSAYIKCIEERRAGNDEFLSAEKQTLAILQASPLPEVAYFLEHFIPAYERTLDELGGLADRAD